MQLASIPGRTQILADLGRATSALDGVVQTLEELNVHTGGTTKAARVKEQTRILDGAVHQADVGAQALRAAAGRLLSTQEGEQLGSGVAYRILDRVDGLDLQGTADALLALTRGPVHPDQAAMYTGTTMAGAAMIRFARDIGEAAQSLLRSA